MATSPSPPRIVRFGVFEVDLAAEEVRKAGLRQKLSAQHFQVLRALLERPQEVVTREELRQRIWPDNTFVDYDLALKKAVNRLREVLGDSAESPRFIETIPRRGYRFIGAISARSVLQDSSASRMTAPADSPEGTAFRTGARFSWKLIATFSLAAIAALLLWLNADNLRTRLFAHSRAEIRSIAVLPLQNLSNDPEQEYFADGISDELITDLAATRQVQVISRTSTMRYKETDKSLPEIARELNVDGIVEGTVQRSGNRVHITAQLVSALTDQHLWAQSYERELRDTLQLEAEIAHDITERVSTNVAGLSGRYPVSAYSVSIEAYDDYLRGRSHVRRWSEEDTVRGIEFLDRSIKRDPNYAPAYAELSFAYQTLAWSNHFPPREVLPRAKEAALKALALDENSAEAHVGLGAVYGQYELNWLAQEREFKRAIQVDPNSSFARSNYALHLIVMGQKEQAVQEINTAIELDPYSPIVRCVSASIFIFIRDYDRAIQEARRAVEIDPTFALGHNVLAGALGRKGIFDEAFEEWLRYLTLDGDAELAHNLESAANGIRGSGDPGQKLAYITLRYYQEKAKKQYVAARTIAATYLDMGSKEEALKWLNEAYAERSTGLYTIAIDPFCDPLRADPRFKDLLRRMNFPR